MNNLSDFILIVFASFFGSLVISLTRGDGKNIVKKVIVLTILLTIFISILRMT